MTDFVNDHRMADYLDTLDAAANARADCRRWTLSADGRHIVRAAPAPKCPTCGHAVAVISTGEAGCWRCLGYWKDHAALDAAICEVEE